jgi:hypothetical protein
MMDYMRIGGIPGCPAILQNPRKPEIQAALQELVATGSQGTRITGVAPGYAPRETPSSDLSFCW